MLKSLENLKIISHYLRHKNSGKNVEKIFDDVKKTPLLDNFLKVSKTYEFISNLGKRAETANWGSTCQEALKEVGMNYKLVGKENVPKKEGVLYVCNHPYGILDGAVLVGGLGSLLEEKGRELKLIATKELKLIGGIEKMIYLVDQKSKKDNLNSIRKALKYLRDGGDLAIYPSGKTSKENLKEYPWNNGLEAFISHSNYIVPMWFSGPNHGIVYNFLSRFKRTERLRNIFSLKEAWNKKGKIVVLNIGKPISSKELKERKDISEKGEYLKQIAGDLAI